MNTRFLPPDDFETLKAVDKIVPALLWEVRSQVETRAVIEAGNNAVLQHSIVAGHSRRALQHHPVAPRHGACDAAMAHFKCQPWKSNVIGAVDGFP